MDKLITPANYLAFKINNSKNVLYRLIWFILRSLILIIALKESFKNIVAHRDFF